MKNDEQKADLSGHRRHPYLSGQQCPAGKRTGGHPRFPRAVLPLRQKVRETTVADVKKKLVADLMSDDNDI